MLQAAGLGLVADEGDTADEERSKEKLDSPSAILRVGARLGTMGEDIFMVVVVVVVVGLVDFLLLFSLVAALCW